MEVVIGALPSVITKLGDLLVGEYNLQKRVKGEIMFLKSELESMHGALEKVSSTTADQVDIQDKIWARDLRELSYDIEDSIDTYMVCAKGNELAVEPHGIKKFIDRSVGLFRKAKIRRKIATEIRDIKSRVEEVSKRRDRYKISNDVEKLATIDPRLFARYEKATNLVGIDEARDDVIKVLIDDNEVSKQQDKVVSIVGFGGLGKTTLANVVYEKLRSQFDCSAFVSVSQNPDIKNLLMDMLNQLTNDNNSTNINVVIDKLRNSLQTRRYFIVIDDIWDISVWKMIRCALPENNRGCKIITTTRILNVAEHIGGSYKLRPLSLENSRILLYGRIFGNEDKNSPDEELVKVSDRILKKCAGIPLAIITMASLLANKGRNKMEWYEVHNNIGTGMENSQDVENMRKILLLSYYYLPSYLKGCLLYLSVFQEDSIIGKNRLIWMWIAEGFIQCGKQSPFQHGESYFNELVNKSLIQPVYDKYNGTIESCRVHDMILDLLRSLSIEENFVTILDDVYHTSPSKKFRRLSLGNNKVDHDKHQVTMSMQQVRSVIVFPSGINLFLTLHGFRMLRVLDLECCRISKDCSLSYIGILFHLRFLGLSDSCMSKLHEEIGNLQFLQTLCIGRGSSSMGVGDAQLKVYVNNRQRRLVRVEGGGEVKVEKEMKVEEEKEMKEEEKEMKVEEKKYWPLRIQSDEADRGICTLPATIVQLRNLTCLRINIWYKGVPNMIGSLTSLEELSLFRIHSSRDIEELGHLVKLRVLSIRFETQWNQSLEKSLVESLNKLQKIQSLDIASLAGCNLDAWVAPPSLRRLELQGCWFSKLPAWMNPSLLSDLSFLWIYIDEFMHKDLEILGRLPALRFLKLTVGRNNNNLGIPGRYTIGACSFPCLVGCKLTGFGGPVIFLPGAMPRLTSLSFNFLVTAVTREVAGSNGGFDLGLRNLVSLEDATFYFDCVRGSKEAGDELRSYLKHDAEMHPNHPTLRINGFQDEVPDKEIRSGGNILSEIQSLCQNR